MIHGVNKERFLGNCSFRCTHGFPSFKDSEAAIWVSRRNGDKRDIGITSMVPCTLMPDGRVGYWGDAKPSVDTPIQLMLYRYYKWAKFMLHSHTYIRDAYWTKKKLPCGAVEEFYEIIKHGNEPNEVGMEINLRGHGSLVMAADISYLKDISYYARPIPEE